MIDPERKAKVAIAAMKLDAAGRALERLDLEDQDAIERMAEGKFTVPRLRKEVWEYYRILASEEE